MSDVVLAKARYGKDAVRVLRVVRNDGWHEVVEYTVKVMLEGTIDTCYTQSDNSVVVTTDSIKNIVNLKAKQSPHVLSPELFALDVASSFLVKYPHLSLVAVSLAQHRWTRLAVSKKPHPHAFRRDGEDVRIVEAEVSRSASGSASLEAKVCGGVKDLLVLKSTGSNFEGFIKDEFTTLPEVEDRIFSTSVECRYSVSMPSPFDPCALGTTCLPPFDSIHPSTQTILVHTFATDDSSSVQATLYKMGQRILAEHPQMTEVEIRMPNKHYVPIDLGWANVDNVKPKEAEVFLPSAHPSGLITATVARKTA